MAKNKNTVSPRRIIAGAFVFVGLFWMCFGFGSQSQALIVTGAAVIVLSFSVRMFSSLRRTPRQWVLGTGYVTDVADQPPESPHGRCSIRLTVDAPGIPNQAVQVTDPRTPSSQWPYPGMELPIEVAADDPAVVRILWQSLPGQDDPYGDPTGFPPRQYDPEPDGFREAGPEPRGPAEWSDSELSEFDPAWSDPADFDPADFDPAPAFHSAPAAGPIDFDLDDPPVLAGARGAAGRETLPPELGPMSGGRTSGTVGGAAGGTVGGTTPKRRSAQPAAGAAAAAAGDPAPTEERAPTEGPTPAEEPAPAEEPTPAAEPAPERQTVMEGEVVPRQMPRRRPTPSPRPRRPAQVLDARALEPMLPLPIAPAASAGTAEPAAGTAEPAASASRAASDAIGGGDGTGSLTGPAHPPGAGDAAAPASADETTVPADAAAPGPTGRRLVDDVVTTYPSAHPGPAGAINGVGITLLVADLPRSIAFYRDRLGFHEVDGGEENSVLASGETRLVLRASRELGTVTRRSVYVNLEVGDVDAVYQELKANGVRFTYAPRPVNRTARLELWAAAFRDPDGHGVALTQWRPAEATSEVTSGATSSRS